MSVFEHQDFRTFVFHPLEVVCRGSETQLQVCENRSKMTYSGSRVRLQSVIVFARYS